MTTPVTGATRNRSNSLPSDHKIPPVPPQSQTKENTPPITGASRTLPSNQIPKDLTVKIGSTEYVMRVYVDDKKVSITDSATMARVQKLANKLIEEIETKNAGVFDGKIVKDITDKGIFDENNQEIHAFDENGNSTWNELKSLILTIQDQSLPGVRVVLNKKDSSTDDGTKKTASTSSSTNTRPSEEQLEEEKQKKLEENRRKNRMF